MRRTSDGLDLGSMMVRAGWAWTLAGDGSEHVRQETEAWTARLGVHDHDCVQVPRR
jgi:endonuclease YncB( thermonuclease family)